MAQTYPQIRIGSTTDYVDMRLQEDGLLVIEVAGTASMQQVREALATGLHQGWLGSSMPTLVDVARFTGDIDWAGLREISQMADWGRRGARPTAVAYVSEDILFTMIVKLVAVFFPHSRHRAFTRREWALDWLRLSMARSAREAADTEYLAAG